MRNRKIAIRILSMILTLTVLCASLPLVVFADQIEHEADFDYALENNGIATTAAYREAVGIESYFPLLAQSVVAGYTGYINLYERNLTYIMPLISTTDSLLPYTLSLVYNSTMAGQTHDASSTHNAYDQSYAPRGMKLNICETIVMKIDEDQDRYFVYEDADGTAHTFWANGGEITDTDGLQLTLSLSGTQNLIMSDVDGNQKLFTSLGMNKYKLEQITDKYGNSVRFTFAGYDRPVSVNLIPNGSDTPIEMLKLVYNQDTLSMVYNPATLDAVILRYGTGMYLQSLDYVKCTENATYTDLEQYRNNRNANTNILPIADVGFTYNNGALYGIYDSVTNKAVYYSYLQDDPNTLRVFEVGEEIGQETDVTFCNGYTEVRTSGEDDALGNSDDIITRYIFDSKGRANSIYSTSLDGRTVYGATLGEYQADDSAAKNKIKATTTLGGSSVNLIYNGGFELYSLVNGAYRFDGWGWYGDVRRVSQPSELLGNGMYCPRFYPEIDEPAAIYQDVVLQPGTYTLSFDINSSALEATYGTVRVYSSDSTSQEVDFVADIPRNTTLLNGNVGRFSTTFDVTSIFEDGEPICIAIEIAKLAENATIYNETVYINNVVLETGSGASEYSFVNFGGFEETFTYYTVFDEWDGYYSIENVSDGFGNALAFIVTDDNSEENFYARQKIVGATPMSATNASLVYNYLVSGYVYVPGGITDNAKPRLRIDAYYYKQTGSTETVVKTTYFDFLTGVDGWQFFAGKFSAGYDEIDGVVYNRLAYIDVVCEYAGAVGTSAYFDNISVVLDEGKTAEEYAYYPSSGLQMMYRYYDYYEYYEYTEQKQIRVSANNKGEMTEYVYDGLGRLVYEISSDFYDTVHESTYYPLRYTINSEGEPISGVTVDSFITKTPKSLTEYTYDDYGLKTSVTVYGSICNSGDGDAIAEIGESGYYTTADTKKLAADYTYYVGENDSRIFGALKTESRDEVYNAMYFYDARDGKLLASVNTDTGTGTVNEYDEYDRLVGVYPASYSATNESYSAITNAESVTYSYDTLHRLSSITTESTVYSFEYDGFDNRTSIYIGDNEIVSYEYNDNNGKLKRVIYANGLTVEYEYNDIDLLNEIWYTENGIKTLRYSYAYNADGSLYGITDEARGEVITYRYDGEGKLLGTAQHSDGDMEIDYSTAYTYYGQNGLVHTSDAYLNFRVGTTPYNVSSGLVYYYNSDQSLNYTALNFPSATGTITYTYDEFDRISTISADYKKSGTVTVQRDEYYTYRTYGDDNTDGLVSQYVSSINGDETVYGYTYDERGYVSTETYGGKTKHYTYDNLGQLYRVSFESGYYYYRYDNAGNIVLVLKRERGETHDPINYEYTSTEWGDLLTSFNGSAITYDALGNPLIYYNGTSFTWQGRRLVGAVRGTKTMSFTYDDNGLRTSKTVNGITTEYYWNGNLLVAEKTPTYLVIYNYDASGRPIGMAYHGSDYTQYQWDVYWFDLNVFGDVVGVYNNDGTKLIEYTYDAWGKCNVSYSNGGASTTAIKNNLRYRSYYLDSDLGLYYLQSRYYDPNTYRFISPDTIMSGANGSLQGLNLYAYCFNNPINMTDGQGNWPKWVESTWEWVSNSFSTIGEFCSNNIGCGVVAAQSYDVISIDNFFCGYESGYGMSSVISGDISKPVSLYVTNASSLWKIWEYKVGIQINFNNGGVAIETGFFEQGGIISASDWSAEVSHGFNKFAVTHNHDVDFKNRTIGDYGQNYVRTIPTAAVIVLSYYTGGALLAIFAQALANA